MDGDALKGVQVMSRKREFLTTSEVARRVGVAPDTIRAAERAGSLRAMKTPRGVRFFDAADVDRFIAKRQRRVAERVSPVGDAA